MKKNTNIISLVVIGAGIIAAVATGMQSRNANAIPKDAIVASGSAQGMEGPVKVEIAFSQDKIYSVTVTEANETPDIGTKAIDALPGTLHRRCLTRVSIRRPSAMQARRTRRRRVKPLLQRQKRVVTLIPYRRRMTPLPVRQRVQMGI